MTAIVEPGSLPARTLVLLPIVDAPEALGVITWTTIRSDSARTDPAIQAGMDESMKFMSGANELIMPPVIIDPVSPFSIAL